jgi:hypothetical protein
MAEYIEGGLVMGLPRRIKEPGKLHRMPQKQSKASWHYDWRGKLVWRALNVGIGLSVLVTAGSIAYLIVHHIH